MALQQQRCEQLDQILGAEDTALLEQEGVLEPAIPQPSSIWGQAGAARGVGGVGERERDTEQSIYSRNLIIRSKKWQNLLD